MMIVSVSGLIDVAWAIEPAQSRKNFREAATLTPADWVGADGLVYPRWDQAGVRGGIPSKDWPVVHTLPDAPIGRDITKELQAALDKHGPGSEGRVIQLPSGTFALSEPIFMIYDNVVIRGKGKTDADGKMVGNLWEQAGVKDGQGTRLQFALPWPEGGLPFFMVSRFRGAVTGDSVFTVCADPCYRFKYQNDPVQPIKTIERLGITFFDGEGKQLVNKDFPPGSNDPHFFGQLTALSMEGFPRPSLR
jgi:hypothetical protein